MFNAKRLGGFARSIGIAVAAGMLPQAVLAGTAFSLAGGANWSVGTQTATVGNDGLFFTVNTAISVDALGYYHDGAAHTNAVGLFRVSDGALLASADVVTTALPLSGVAYDWVNITPISLSPGSEYAVVGLMGIGQTAEYVTAASVGNMGTGPEISFTGYKYNYASSLSLPASSDSMAYVGPNFTYSIPTSGSTATLCLAGVVLATRRRRG